MNNTAIQTLLGGIILISLSGLGALVFKDSKLAKNICTVLICSLSTIWTIRMIYLFGKMSGYSESAGITLDSCYSNDSCYKTSRSIEEKIMAKHGSLSLFDNIGMYIFIVAVCLFAIVIFSNIYESATTNKNKNKNDTSEDAPADKVP